MQEKQTSKNHANGPKNLDSEIIQWAEKWTGKNM